MKRRKLLLGIGGTAIGGSTILGSGAFSSVTSQRRTKIEIAEDTDAYLGLDGCPDSPNSSYTTVDDSGHFAVEMSPANPTDAGGEGVPVDAKTNFHNVFQICNQGKQEVCIWIEAEITETLELDPAYDHERIVDFYLGSDPEDSIVGAANAIVLPVGDCICVGIRTVTKGLEIGDQLIEGDEIKIHADAECPPEDQPPTAEETAWALLNGDPDPTENRLNEIENIGANRWGWYMPYTVSSGPTAAEFWAGAGQNNLENGTRVGDVDIDDGGNGGNLTVDITMTEGTLLGSDLYVDTSTDRLRDINAAPGQFDYDDSSPEYDEATSQYVISLADIDGGVAPGDEIIIALHGDVEV